MGDIFFLLKKLLTTAASFRAICSSPYEFKCRPCLVKYSRSRSVSNIFTLLYNFILLFNCPLNLTTSLFTQEEGIRSYLGGAVISTIFTFCLFSMKLYKCLKASLELFFPMSFDPLHTTAFFEFYNFFHCICDDTHSCTWFY